MILKFVKLSLRWAALNAACLTMVLSPVAMGRESEALNEKKLQTYLQEFGLNEKTTLGAFWEKSKAYYPGFIYKDLEKFVQENKNLSMPQMTVSTVKGTDGMPVTMLRMVSGTKTNTIQFFDEKNKWAKFNNVVLSENDMRNVGDIFKRVEASDIRLKKEADQYLEKKGAKKAEISPATLKQNEKVIADFARFKGFPRMTPQQWKLMTPMQRAGFIVSMRLLWKDARGVLRVEQARREAATTKPAKKFSSFDEFSKVLLGDVAEAAGKGTTEKPRTKTNSSGSAATPDPKSDEVSVVGPKAQVVADANSKKCIVAGWTSSEGKGTNYAGQSETCSENNILNSQKAKYREGSPELTTMQQALTQCEEKPGSKYLACNPLVYGYDRSSGSAICVDKSQKSPGAPPAGNYQKATWWEGPCDKASPLSTNQILDDLKLTDSQYAENDKRYDQDGNLIESVARKQIARVEVDQKNEYYKLTKSYLDSVLLNKNVAGVSSIADLLKGNKPWDQTIDNMLIDVQTQFEVEIGLAIQSCERSITRKDNVDKNQKGACDQLHRRWLFTERVISEYRAKSCLGGSTYIWKLDEETLSADQIALAMLNKTKLHANDNLCQCPAGGPAIKFNDAKTCVGTPIDNSTRCPDGMVQVGEKSCACAGSTENIPIDDALHRASLEGVAKMCEKPKCDKPAGIEGYSYDTCECTNDGKLTDENEQGFVSKIFNKQETKTPNWVCKKSSLLPWVLGALGIVALVALFSKHKRPTPPKPPAVCSLACSGNTTINPSACKCDQNPPIQTCAPKAGVYPVCFCALASACVPGQQIYNMLTCQCDNVPQPVICADGSTALNFNKASCPKCTDGSYRSSSSTSRPGGCPQSTEGGSGTNQCKDKDGKVVSCSGGIPAATRK